MDCLSVDTAVGGLYNFISGSNGTRAIPFLQRLSASLLEYHLEATTPDSTVVVETTLSAMSKALRELLRREQRATFHEDLPDLIDSVENVAEATGIDQHSVTFHVVNGIIRELRGSIARANGLLQHEQAPQVDGVSTTAVTSTYPRDIILPQNRHNNDNMDITKIKVFPTEDEIRSNHPEFLPSTDLDQPHFLMDQAERHLDTHFRLLRHDVFGELNGALAGAMVALENDPTLLDSPRFSLGDIRAYSNPKAHVRYISFDHRHSLEAQISFPQPGHLRKKTPSERRKWWEESKRLEEGSLLCLLLFDSMKSSILFLTVSEKCTDTKHDVSLSSEKYHEATIKAKLATRSQDDLGLLTQVSCQNARGLLMEFPSIIPATFVTILENIQVMQRLSRLPFRQWILPDRVLHGGLAKHDIPPPLYARGTDFTFSLGSISKDTDDNLSLSSRLSADDTTAIDELETRTKLDRGQCQALIAALSREFAFIQGPPGTGKSYLGVQLMTVLLTCKTKADLGPVVVVYVTNPAALITKKILMFFCFTFTNKSSRCYTNHALDQFLEHLINVGIDKLIRIGGQSRSKILEGKNLRIISQSETKTKSEGYLLAMTYKELEQLEKTIQKFLGILHGSKRQPGWSNLKHHLARNHPLIHAQFSRVDEDGFKTVGREPFDLWIGDKMPTSSHHADGAEPLPEQIEQLLAQATRNAHSILSCDRHRLVEFWAEEMRAEVTDQLFEATKHADDLQQQLTNIHDEVDRRVLQTADVIGVTTTGLARRIATLQHVRCKVVICEEAGEVMEPHMLSALLPSVEHFIQIGDHQQLRPQINNYKLSLESKQGNLYQLDRSQFERLSVGERGRPAFPVAQLSVQRRMRPEISTLIRETVYPRLLDHVSTKSLPDVVGMRNNVFWLDHTYMEEGAQADVHQKSHSNVWEVDMVHALVRHIVRQGIYDSSDVAVLTPYTGQLQKLRGKMRNDFEIVLSERDQETLAKEGFAVEDASTDGRHASDHPDSGIKPLEKKKLSELLRLATVDNFQGEEAKIVIVSLVRSNKERKVGFLRTTNRINVLLSRAQHGMYLIGNTDTYSNQSMWSNIHGMLQATEAVGPAFGLCCPRHPDTEIQVFQPEDFAMLSPEGGCRLACDRRLADCGHRCQARCHSETMHQVFSCPQPCQRLHSPCKHLCQKQTCGEDCGLCQVILDDVRLLCEHSKDNVPCYQTQDLRKIKCTVLFQKEVPGCKHIVETQCSRDVTSVQFRCPSPCETILACGHLCPGSCGQCHPKDADRQSIKHKSCSKICGRRFGTCNHTCQRNCHDGTDCCPCPAPCEVRCAHSTCTLKCHKACAPCIEKCTWSCEHQGDCCMPCSAPCSRLPCNQRCSRDLSCGHRCPGICGERCPEDYCQSCSGRKEARVDLLEMKTYSEVDLDETPIVVLGCGHFFIAETLDGHVGMAEVYEQDVNGNFTGLRDVSAVLARSIPRCPDCQRPVRQHATQRFNRVINRAVIDEMTKRFLVDGKAKIRDLEQEILDLEHKLEDSRQEIILPIRQASAHLTGQINLEHTVVLHRKLQERHDASRRLEKAIQTFRNKAADKHQPAQKLYDAIVHATRRRSIDHLMTDLNIADSVPAPARDRRITFGGRIAQLQAECIILTDKFDIAQVLKSMPSTSSIKLAGGAPNQLAKPFFQTCKTFIDDCDVENLPKLRVEASLYYARTARSHESYCRSIKTEVDQASGYVKAAKELLEKAKQLCKQPFQDANSLRIAVDESLKLLRKEWYEEVTAEEIAAIKLAMVSGPRGITTHSGHWYNCVNGHPVSFSLRQAIKISGSHGGLTPISFGKVTCTKKE